MEYMTARSGGDKTAQLVFSSTSFYGMRHAFKTDDAILMIQFNKVTKLLGYYVSNKNV